MNKNKANTMYKLIAFDAYGTLFDVYSVGMLANEIFPGSGLDLALMWRDRQIEYTRLVNISDPSADGSKYYLPFWDLTLLSLRYVCKRMHLPLDGDSENRLMAEYAQLHAFEDSLSVLKKIKEKGIATAILSNGNKQMLSAVVEINGLKPYLDRLVTVEEARVFKTSPHSYNLLIKEFAFRKEEILFVSSNAWDVLGASWFGFDVFWVNRQSYPFEEIGNRPNYEGKSLSEVLGVV